MSGIDVHVQAQAGAFRLDVAFASEAAITALIGPSGAGKTLTLRAIAGLLRPEAGHVRVHGRALFDATAGLNVATRDRRVGYVFQSYALFPHLTVAQNIAFGLHRWSPAEAAARVEELAALVELPDRLHARPTELSGGQQQRVALARALAPRPELVLLDEPFAAVDPALRERLREGVHRALHAQGTRALLVTHDPADAALASRIVRMDRGRALTSA